MPRYASVSPADPVRLQMSYGAQTLSAWLTFARRPLTGQGVCRKLIINKAAPLVDTQDSALRPQEELNHVSSGVYYGRPGIRQMAVMTAGCRNSPSTNDQAGKKNDDHAESANPRSDIVRAVQ